MSAQFVDSEISRSKFNREVERFRNVEHELGRRGWFLASAKFPDVFVVFASPKLQPSALIFGAVINFTNYDFVAPSVMLVDPLSREPYSKKNVPTRLPRAVKNSAGQLVPQEMLQAYGDDDIPFLCLPGVREYHSNPAHTGDSWFLYRKTPEGTLYFLLEQLSKYGVEPLTSYSTALRAVINGFQQTYCPE